VTIPVRTGTVTSMISMPFRLRSRAMLLLVTAP
jgi:hypothetical protein